MSTHKARLHRKFANKEYRQAWNDESVRTTIPFQIHANREARGLSQTELGELADMKPNAISRLESQSYRQFSIDSLLRLANAFDCGLLVKFVPFERMVDEFADVSQTALVVQSFEPSCQNREEL